MIKSRTYEQDEVDEIVKDTVETLKDYKTAIKDARYILNHYKHPYPAEAWETIRRILNNPILK